MVYIRLPALTFMFYGLMCHIQRHANLQMSLIKLNLDKLRYMRQKCFQIWMNIFCMLWPAPHPPRGLLASQSLLLLNTFLSPLFIPLPYPQSLRPPLSPPLPTFPPPSLLAPPLPHPPPAGISASLIKCLSQTSITFLFPFISNY